MKNIFYNLCIAGFLLSCSATAEDSEDQNVETQQTDIVAEETKVEEKKKKKPKSPRIEAVGDNMSIDYGSPYVKGRTIWGDLVSYGKVWRAGANETTAITFQTNVMIGESEVEAGTYALFIIPEESGNWTVVLNEKWSKAEHDAWGAYDYKTELDVLRFEVSPEKGTENTESLTFSIDGNTVMFAWEFMSFTFDANPK